MKYVQYLFVLGPVLFCGCGELTNEEVREITQSRFAVINHCLVNSDCEMVPTECGTFEYNKEDRKKAQEIVGFCAANYELVYSTTGSIVAPCEAGSCRQIPSSLSCHPEEKICQSVIVLENSDQ